MLAFSFTPRTEDQLRTLTDTGLLKEGVYPFTVKEVTQEVSKAGNNMLKIRISIINPITMLTFSVIDYLLTTEKMMYKLKHFCESIGFEQEYAKGSFIPEQCKGKSGMVSVGIKKGDVKLSGEGFYPDRNYVRDYIKSANNDQNKSVDKDEFSSEDVPF